MVVAPEHPLLKELTTADQKAEVEAYVAQAGLKSELDRSDLSREKTGVFTGSYAINPVNNQQDSHLGGRLCTNGIWNRSHHGCSRSRYPGL